MATTETSLILSADAWRARVCAHRSRADEKTAPALKRRAAGRPHPVEDFLFTYFRFSFGKIRQWHPPVGTGLEAADDLPDWFRRPPYSEHRLRVHADAASIPDKELARLRWIRELLVATRDRTPNFGCFGIHEWAMVFRGNEIRHQKTVPLRLPQAEVDAFVESRPICCSHFDAFRFFTPAAQPLNKLQPGLMSRPEFEQPGCVHAGMDLYKWAGKAMPWVGTDLWFDCFLLALELRDLDMRASPYDLTQFGLEAIPVETAEGRRQYEAEQRRLSEAAAPLRQELIVALDRVFELRS